MKRSDSPPDYMIERIARHARTLLGMPPQSIRQAEAQRLLKKEIVKLEKYKQKKDG